MATNLQEILGRDIDSVKSLKQAIRELQDSLVGLDTTSEEYKTTSEKLIVAQEALKNTTKAGIDANNAAKDSIVGMQQEYSKLYDTYKKLSDEERNSDFGKSMAERLSKLSENINKNNKEVGNFKTNIGHYAESATEAFNKMGVSIGGLQTPLKMAAGGTKTLGTALKTLAANPIVLVITALVAILAKAAESIKKNEELTNRLQQAMATFKPILDAVANAFDFLAGLLVKTVEGLAKVAEKVLSVIPGMKKAIDSHKELAKATNDLTKATREANVENSKKQAEIERLREEASATDDVIEKKKLLEQAKELQRQVDEQNIALAQEELRILEEYAAKTANSAEENEKLAAAQQKVNDAIAQGERNMRMYNKQISATEKSTSKATSAGKNYREEAKKLNEQLIEDNKTELQKLTEKYEKEKKLLEKYHYDTKLLTKKYEEDKAKIEEEARKKAEEKRLKALNQRRQDLETEISTDEAAGDRILAIEKKLEVLTEGQLQDLELLDEMIGKIAHDLTDWSIVPVTQEDYERAVSAVSAWEKIINEGGFEALGKEYNELKEAVNAVNAAYGTSVTTTSNLSDAIKQTKTEINALKKEWIEAEIEDIYNTVYLPSEMNSIIQDSWKDYIEQVEANNRELLETEANMIQSEAALMEDGDATKIALMKRYYAIVQELRDKDMQAVELNAQRNREVMESALDFSSSIEGMMNSIEQLMQAEIQSGKLTEREAARKKKALENLQKIQLGVAIANIFANTAAGIMDVWRGYSSELVLNAETAAAAGPGAAISKAALDAKSLASAILRTSTLATQGGAQIAAAVGGYISKGTAVPEDEGVGAAPMLIDSTPYSYTKTVQSQEEEDKLNQPIWVSVVDVENALGQQATVKEESSF